MKVDNISLGSKKAFGNHVLILTERDGTSHIYNITKTLFKELEKAGASVQG